MRKTYSKNGIIALCSIVYFVSYFSRKDFAAVMVEMLSEGVMDKSVAGLIGTMLFIFYGVGQLVSGYLGDKLKPKYLIIAGLAVTSVCNLLMPLLPNPALMIPVWGLNGFAQAMLWPPIVRIFSDNLDHEKYVTANLVVTAAAHIATILLYLYVPVCLEFMEWETVFYTATALALIAMAAFIISLGFVLPDDGTVKKAEQRIAEKNVEKLPISKILISSGIIPIFGCIVMTGFLRDGIESWLPTLYSEAFARDASESILVSVILPIFSIVSVTVITAVHKKSLFNNEIRGAGLLFMIAIFLCVPLAILISYETVVARFVCLVLAALVCAVMHGVNFLLISCLPGRYARLGRASTVSGLTNACIYIGAAISMYGIALVADNLGWAATVISWIIVAGIGVTLAVLAYRAYTKFIKTEE